MNNRRGFIKTLLAGTGILASGALTTVVAGTVLEENTGYNLVSGGFGDVPDARTFMYCDGIHDDALALAKWWNNEPVYYLSGEPVGTSIRNKKFKLNSTLFDYPHFPENARILKQRTAKPTLEFCDNTLDFSDAPEGTFAFQVIIDEQGKKS